MHLTTTIGVHAKGEEEGAESGIQVGVGGGRGGQTPPKETRMLTPSSRGEGGGDNKDIITSNIKSNDYMFTLFTSKIHSE